MKTFFKSLTQRENAIFLVMFVFSTCLYLFNLTFSDIWIDESFTKALVKHSFSDMVGLIKNDFHPPLYFYGLKIFTGIFGLSLYTIRLFSVIGVLSLLILGYTAGQRVFGKQGALYFCFLLLTLPMLASHSHIARMYTWAAFAVVGVFIYAYQFITTNKRSDLILFGLFTIIAAYTHYFALIAAGGANLFVFGYLLLKKNRAWISHIVCAFIVAILYLPWMSVLLMHTHKAQVHFWVPKLSWQTIFSCFIGPFVKTSITSYIMMVIIYGLTIMTIYQSFIKRNDNQKLNLALVLSLFIFYFTFLTTAVISLFFQPILYVRYITTIVTMLMVPPAIFFMTSTYKWIKVILLGILFCGGMYISVGLSYFSYGPYKQSIEYLSKTYPEIKKVVHVIEISAGPLIEYSESTKIKHYWLNTDKTIVYTNMNVFDQLQQVSALDAFLKKDEIFCVVSFPQLPFNTENLSLILSKSNIIRIDTVIDNKVKKGNALLLYVLKYK